MGLPLPDDQDTSELPPKNMQKYYSETYREYVSCNENVAYSSRQVVGSIYSRTRVPTDTHSNRDLALLDIDKLISFDAGSLDEQGDRVKYMRMVAGLMNQSRRRIDETPMELDELVRIARLNFNS